MNPLSTIKPFIIQHEPDILIWLGVAGFVSAIPLTIRGSIRAYKKIQNKKTELKKTKLTFTETIDCSWKEFLPVIITTAGSLTCVIAGNHISSKRAAALAASYTIAETALQEYKDKTKEIVGEKKEQTIREAVAQDKANKEYSTTVLTGDGDYLFIDELTGQKFKSNWAHIQQIANKLNADAIGGQDTITVNEWLDALNLKSVSDGDIRGWDVYSNGGRGLIDITITATIDSDNKPCGVISYNNTPKILY